MIKKQVSRISIYFLFSFAIFNILWITSGIAYAIFYELMNYDVFSPTLLDNALLGIGVMVIISSLIGTVITGLISRMMLKPVTEVLTSMKKLAGGDFSVRINSADRMRPRELIDFANEFNATARELGSIEMLRVDFVNNFSHEFKTPIASIRGFASLLKNENLTAEQKSEYLDILISESDRLTSLATNILKMSNIDNQTHLIKKRTYDLSEQIRQSILILDTKWIEKDLTLNADIEDTLEYNGNKELLAEVWINILDNAIKFSKSGGKLRIQLYSSQETIIFTTKDYGYGMDSETMAHIYDKFYQADHSRKTDGNGIGMSVVKKIVELHKGKTEIESEPGNGTLITVILPK